MRELSTCEVKNVSGGFEYTWGNFAPIIGSGVAGYYENAAATAAGMVGATGTLDGVLAFNSGLLVGTSICNSVGSTSWFINGADSFFGGIDYVRNNWWNG